jgi:hypothetical protein
LYGQSEEWALVITHEPQARAGMGIVELAAAKV